LVDWLIGVFTLSKYSHVEIEINGLSMSASLRDGTVRAKHIDYSNAEWNTITINTQKELIDNTMSTFSKYAGKRYDKLGALSSVFGICIKNDKVFCSEFVGECLGIKEPCRFTPGSLYRYRSQPHQNKHSLVQETAGLTKTNRS
jgi:hypothetical protein